MTTLSWGWVVRRANGKSGRRWRVERQWAREPTFTGNGPSLLWTGAANSSLSCQQWTSFPFLLSTNGSQLMARYLRKQIVALCCHRHSFSFISLLVLPFPSSSPLRSLKSIIAIIVDGLNWKDASTCLVERTEPAREEFTMCSSIPNFTVILNCPSMERELIKVRQTFRAKVLLGSEIVKCSKTIKCDWQQTDVTLLNSLLHYLIYHLTLKVVCSANDTLVAEDNKK